MLELIVDNVESRPGRVARGVPGIVLPGLAAAALLFGPAALQAQDGDVGPSAGTVSVDVRGGVAIPVAEMDALAQTGASFGGGVALHLSRRVALRADGEYQLLTGARTSDGVLFADMNSLNVTGGLEVHFLDPKTRWTGTLSLGAGISTLETEATTDDGTAAPVDADLTHLALRGGSKLGYQVSDRVDIYLEPAVYLATFDRDETRPFAAVTGDVTPFDVGWTIPLQAGVRFHLR
jgi:hypothetical protein